MCGKGAGDKARATFKGFAFLIQVGSFGQPVGGVGDGFLTIGLPPCVAPNYTDDVFEDNDTAAQATPVTVGTYADLFVIVGDPDYFSIQVPAGMALHAVMHGPSGQISIEDASGTLLAGDAGFGGLTRSAFYQPQSQAAQQVFVHVANENLGLPAEACSHYDLELLLVQSIPGYESFCLPAQVNSAGWSTRLSGTGFTGPLTAGMYSYGGPEGQFGYYLIGSQPMKPGISVGQGRFCLGGHVARYNRPAPFDTLGQFSSTGYSNQFSAASTSFQPGIQLPGGLGSIAGGKKWHFQLWHREPSGGSNFSNGLSVMY